MVMMLFPITVFVTGIMIVTIVHVDCAEAGAHKMMIMIIVITVRNVVGTLCRLFQVLLTLHVVVHVLPHLRQEVDEAGGQQDTASKEHQDLHKVSVI